MSCCPTTSKGIAGMCLRVAFGVSLFLVGISHYMTMTAFKGMVMEDLGALEPLGALWAYVLPALMIVGGALIAAGLYLEVAAWAAGVALASIPIGMLLKSVLGGIPLQMEAVVNAFIFLLLFKMSVKCGGCCKSSKE